MSGKVVSSNGTSHRVTVCSLADGGFRIEGAEGIRNGEKILLLLPDAVVEASVRWVVGDQAGAVALG
ncbi:MAG: hypothetical protein J7500_06340 [Sphingomonas sp.]|uniref:hypothetical protein n=1 Tax=Sphingomonas sp. TaxID=28214 RepID=UPI001B0A8C03|nr:hypothetical protein [Sphingomonas sp.]MBO9622315.1 hypothetical protein [Sphingomonas sp.]